MLDHNHANRYFNTMQKKFDLLQTILFFEKQLYLKDNFYNLIK